MKLNEFDIIKQFFKNQNISRDDVILGIGDDCAIVETPPENQLAITIDTLVDGVHFPHDTPAYDVGYKSLAVNLSDLAAMGATPAWITAALTLPKANESWLKDFTRGLFDLAARYNVQLIGGDLTHGPLTITIQAHGLLPKNKALKRSTAKPGDLIYVTNTPGDAALGLLFLQNKISLRPEFQDSILKKINRPEPQIEIGKKLLNIANACVDISDGLAADLGHILEESNLGATLYVDQLPLSNALRESMPEDNAIALALNGGDDYELCFTAPKDKQSTLTELTNITCIGVITETSGLNLLFQDGRKYNGAIQGYNHFSS